ncbi:MAG TPA: hypothetical protein VFO38_01600 [Candidatus Saccharimonadales bacterium]|nr:hypothetical protein [Candidatus Saccharimonadales bacterium]
MSRSRVMRLSLAQHYLVGADGMPISMLTNIRVRALAAVDFLRYVFDTGEVRVEGVSGCRAGEVETNPHDARYWKVDLHLDVPLKEGEVADLSYRTLFDYSAPPLNELSQGEPVFGLPEVSLVVEFHPEKLGCNTRWVLFNAERELDGGQLSLRQPDNEIAGPHVRYDLQDLRPGHFVAIRWDWAP